MLEIPKDQNKVTIGPKSTKGDTYHANLRRQALRMSHSHEPLLSRNPLLTKSVHTVMSSHQMHRKIFSQRKELFKANYLHNSKEDWVLRPISLPPANEVAGR